MSDTDSDNDMDWEEVVPSQIAAQTIVIHPPEESASLQITIQAPLSGGKQAQTHAKREKTKAESLNRFIRLQAHRLHTIALLTNATIRNWWANDELLHARLMSLTPLSLQTPFAIITPRNQPDRQLRGRQFEAALTRLVGWWSTRFLVNHELGIRHQSFDETAAKASRDAKGKGKAKAQDDSEDELYGEDRIRSAKSLMKHALMMKGSRDSSAQLFTALCRALGLPARLVVSLQSVLWRTDKRKPSEKESLHANRLRQQARKKEKDAQIEAAQASMVASSARDIGSSSGQQASPSPMSKEIEISDADMEGALTSLNVDGKNKGKGRDMFPGEGNTFAGATSHTESSNQTPTPLSKPPIRLRKSRPTGRRLGGLPKQRNISREESSPVFWTEVYSRPDGRWLPVDPIHNHVDKRKRFEPLSNDKFNHMLYVVAIEEDGYIRDVTQRYAKNFGTKIVKERRTGMGKKDWWDSTGKFSNHPNDNVPNVKIQQRDDAEDEEFEHMQELEGMPSSISGFKDHPLYVLGRHLHQDEVIYPLTQIGTFRGESVYSRANVTSVKTAENWMRSGRVIKDGEQPLKMSKIRAVTLHKQRAIEVAAEAQGMDGTQLQQGMYARWQTKLYLPPPIIEGKVPKNDFGNIDLYVPSMLPEGGVHIPYKGTAKIAKQLGIDYAEAVTGFEFKNRRAFPVLDGVVIPEDRESELLEVYWKSAQAASEREKQKKLEKVIKHWTRLVQGLRIRQRLQDKYYQTDTHEAAESKTENVSIDSFNSNVPVSDVAHDHHEHNKGSLARELDENITPYTLPRDWHETSEKQPPGQSQDHSSPSVPPKLDRAAMTNVIQQPVCAEDRAETSVSQVAEGTTSAALKGALLVTPKSMNSFAAASIAEFARKPAEDSKASQMMGRDTGNAPPAGSTRRRQRQRVDYNADESGDEDNDSVLRRKTRSEAVPPSNRVLRSRNLRSSAK
ncbi:uncharacterized protein EI90DRAFT_3012505 [Cantharellus anzutake]|uniref:uncharacterized protein n=1 Tax=Cantharellus anzutake TaxID=1750568 RepID=UPI001905D378|nr:uncharacterized protein EI90DRAFT_3012505 [Cantharellus anzutake]KAF8340733.1 hypothetical protein EI90DRAFT_3012505 [Cantharellus anzutake]